MMRLTILLLLTLLAVPHAGLAAEPDPLSCRCENTKGSDFGIGALRTRAEFDSAVLLCPDHVRDHLDSTTELPFVDIRATVRETDGPPPGTLIIHILIQVLARRDRGAASDGERIRVTVDDHKLVVIMLVGLRVVAGVR